MLYCENICIEQFFFCNFNLFGQFFEGYIGIKDVKTVAKDAIITREAHNKYGKRLGEKAALCHFISFIVIELIKFFVFF